MPEMQQKRQTFTRQIHPVSIERKEYMEVPGKERTDLQQLPGRNLKSIEKGKLCLKSVS